MKKQLKENERKYSSQLNVKEEEIQRITRRNEVLSEAMTRMTQSGSTPTYSSASTAAVGSGSGSGSASSNGGALSYEQYSRQQQSSSSHYPHSSPHITNTNRTQQLERSTIPDRIHDGRFMNPTEKPLVSPISHTSTSFASVSRSGTPMSPLRRVPQQGSGEGEGDDNNSDDEATSQYQAPKLNAPSPLEPPGQLQQQRAMTTTTTTTTSPLLYSTKPALRSNSATVRTPLNSSAEYSNAQAMSSQHIRSNYQTQKTLNSNDGDYGFPVTGGAGGGGGGSGQLSNDEVNASLSRVQQAINSRRSNSTPRGGLSSRASSAPSTSFSNLEGTSGGPGLRVSPRSNLDPGVGERSLPIRAEYDSSYASSAQEVYQREIFSPKRVATPQGPSAEGAEGFMSPSLTRRNKQQSPRHRQQEPEQQRSKKTKGLPVAVVPTLEMDDYQLNTTNSRPTRTTRSPAAGDKEGEGEGDDLLPSQPSMSSLQSKDSTGSGSGHFSQKIRHEVECGKDQLLPYSPQRSLRGNAHGLKHTKGEEASLGGYDATPIRRKEISASASASVLSAASGGSGGGGKSQRSHSATRTTSHQKPSPYLSSAPGQGPGLTGGGGKSSKKSTK
jgi:hypothetical protein